MQMIDAALLLRADGERVEDGESARHGRSAGETVERDHAMTAVHRLEWLPFTGLV